MWLKNSLILRKQIAPKNNSGVWRPVQTVKTFENLISKLSSCSGVQPPASKWRSNSEVSANFASVSEVWTYSLNKRDGLRYNEHVVESDKYLKAKDLVFAVGRRKTTTRLFGRSPKNDRLFDFFRPTFFCEITQISTSVPYTKLVINTFCYNYH